MFTILVSIMAMFGYFGGVNIMVYIVMDLVFLAIIGCWLIWIKILKVLKKK